jgi:hypothetical protein
MKSYEARLMVLQMTQRRHGVPVSEQPGQEVPDVQEVEAFVLAQKAKIGRVDDVLAAVFIQPSPKPSPERRKEDQPEHDAHPL